MRPDIRLYDTELNDAALIRHATQQFRKDGIPDGAAGVVGGAMDGVERVLREALAPGDSVGVEDPCFGGVRDLLAGLGLIPVPIELDSSGPVPESFARALRAGVSAVVITPRAQNPTGASISKARAGALHRMLKTYPDVVLIEDDHAGPVSGTPAVTVGVGAGGRWVYIRSVSKWLGPDLRVALIVGDHETVDHLETGQLLGMRWVSHVLQELVIRLWKSRETLALLKRAEHAYTKRRQGFVADLARHHIPASGGSGLNVWIPVPEEAHVVQALAEKGWAVAAGERFRIDTPPAVRITVADMTPQESAQVAQDLAGILRPRRRTAVV